jgi:HK97 family phage major capsid protein
MSARLKTLQETRGAKVKELESLVAAARNENRSLTADEGKKYDGIYEEVTRLDADTEREIRHIAITSQRAPGELLTSGERRDVARFDIGRVLRSLAKGDAHRLDGVEGEMLKLGEEEARNAGINTESGELKLPRAVVQKRAMTATGTTTTTGDQGGQTIQTNIGGLLDAFYNALVLIPAGATVLSDLRGNFNWPRYVKPSDPASVTENGAAGAQNPLVSTVSFSPQRIAAYTTISDQLLIQSNEAIEAVVRRNIQKQASVYFQKMAIYGAGHGSNQPQGILGVTGIGSVAGGTNGAAPTWAELISTKSKVSEADALQGNLGWLINAKTEAQLQTTLKNSVSGTDSRYIIDSEIAPGVFAGYKYWLTNSVPSNLVKGTSGSVCSAIIFGDFQDLVLAFWGGMTLDLIRDTVTAQAGQRMLVTNMYGDSNIVRAESFSAIQDALTPNG